MQAYHDPVFLREIWALFAAGVLIFFLRLMVRLRTVGIRGLQGDDAFALIAVLSYTACTIVTCLVYYNGSNLDFSAEEMVDMNMAERESVSLGSKMELVAWYTYVTLIWSLKGCLIFFYHRVTVGLGMQRWTTILAVVSCLCYLAVFLTLTFSCYPIRKNWQLVPKPAEQCVLGRQNLYATAALNIFTDMLILCIPLPLLYNMIASLPRKAALAFLLLPGVFVITAAVIRVTQSIGPQPSTLNMNRWAARECLAAIIAVNLPILKPVVMKEFWRPGLRLESTNTSRYNPSDFNDVERKFHQPDDSIYELEPDVPVAWEPAKPSTQSREFHARERSWDDGSSQDSIIRKPKPFRAESTKSSSHKSIPSAFRRKREKGPQTNSVTIETTYEMLRESRADTPPGFRTFGDSVSLNSPKFGNRVTIERTRRPVSWMK